MPTIAGLTLSTVFVMAFFLDFEISSSELFCCSPEVNNELLWSEPVVTVFEEAPLGAREYPSIPPTQIQTRNNKSAFLDILFPT
jgi:hypothetical protein